MSEDGDTRSSTKETTITTPIAAAEEKAASTTTDETPAFPPPKYVVTIVSPRFIHLHENDASLDEWKEFEEFENNNREDTTTILNLHVLLVSLLNRLLRARLFPRRAVHSYMTPAAGSDDHEFWVVFSILTPATVLPILLSKCEHFGVGNLVGLVYAVPLETCVLPLINHTVEEEEEEGLLTVPSHFDATPLVKPTSVDSKSASLPQSQTASPPTTTTVSLTDATAAAVLVMAPSSTSTSHKKTKTPDPATLRQVMSETLPEQDHLAAAHRAADDGADNKTLRRTSSDPNISQSSSSNNNKAKDNKDTNATTDAKPKEPHLLEIIPEVKKVPPKEEKDTTTTAGTSEHNNTKSKSDLASSSNTKSALIEKVLDARREWLATASRIRVEQVAEEVTAAASLTWDYLLFVVCAAAIASVGLATNSSVTVLASMLVSPIMGPILAVTFGTMIQRPTMIRTALRNEAISLLLCILVGAFGGLVVWWTRLYESSDWPANEMTTRGEPVGLAAGILIALPSGMATALSTLGKNSSGLVGVAISLSLLPPAVNAGLCWMFALLENSRLVDKEPDDDTNYWRVGSTSFGLTLINIVCIWLAGVFTFWLKEVAPVEHKNAFWSRDLKIARQKRKDTGAAKIKDGLQAALDLKKTYNVDVGDQDPTSRRVKNAMLNSRRRVSSPTSLWEDALLFDRNQVFNRKQSNSKLPERRIQRASSDGILEQTEALGGIDKATEFLFSNQLFRGGNTTSDGDSEDPGLSPFGLDMSYHPDEVPPEDVYQEILWDRFRNPKM